MQELTRDEISAFLEPVMQYARACGLSVVFTAACGATSRPNDRIVDSAIVDSTAVDSAGASAGPDAAALCDQKFSSSACWTTFVSEGLTANTSDFFGAAFDGHNVLFVNRAGGPHGFTVEYDTQSPFEAPASWSTFDTQVLSPTAYGFTAAVFDGQSVYLAPNLHSTVVRHDGRSALDAATSWSAVDLPESDAGGSPPAGFMGAVFDGRYVSFVPGAGGLVVRYDTQSVFDAGTSWTSFDLTTLPGARGGFSGGAYDGRYVYFVPHADATGLHGVVARYDTLAEFSSAASWSTFDATTVDSSAAGFAGASFDGRYLYFAPNMAAAAGLRCVIVRYDTAGAFGAASSWSAFDTGGVGSQGLSWAYDGAAFDGHHVYFAPAAAGVPALQYDTQSSFTSTAAWSAFSWPEGNVAGYHGAVFDGHFVYFVPADYSMVTRFDAVAGP